MNYFDKGLLLENKVYDRLNNQTVGIDKIPTTQNTVTMRCKTGLSYSKTLPWGTIDIF